MDEVVKGRFEYLKQLGLTKSELFEAGVNLVYERVQEAAAKAAREALK